MSKMENTTAYPTGTVDIRPVATPADETRNRFHALGDNRSEILWDMDLKGTCIYCSPNLASVLEYYPWETWDKSPADFMTEADSTRLLSMLAASLAEAKGLIVLHHTLARRDGCSIKVESRATPIHDEIGNLMGYHCITSELSHLAPGCGNRTTPGIVDSAKLNDQSGKLVSGLLPWG